MIPFPNKKYQVIYADPPWPIEKIKRKVRPNQVDMDYPVMSIEEIVSLPVRSLAQERCSLFLWTTQTFLPITFAVIEAWGFKYHITITWDKRNGMCLCGFHRRTELLLFGYRGKLETFPHRKAMPTIVVAKSDRHSSKPPIFRKLIEPFGCPRIELFARDVVPNWDAWGNEVCEADGQMKVSQSVQLSFPDSVPVPWSPHPE